MLGELCRVTTADGLRLEGLLQTPTAGAGPRGAVDGCLLVHGSGSHFYASGVLEQFARQAVDAGLPALRINTRGHDLMARIPKAGGGSVAGGAAYEDVAESVHDIAAWIAFLTGRGCRRIALVGHSSGGVKSLYALARNPIDFVAGIVAISPPRFCHANFLSHPQAGAFREDFAAAQRLVAAGRGDELMHVRQPLPLTMTAAGVIAKYGPDDPFDIVRLIPRVACPVLVLVGSESARSHPAFAGLPEALIELSRRNSHLTCRIVDGADINYANDPAAPYPLASAWMEGVL